MMASLHPEQADNGERNYFSRNGLLYDLTASISLVEFHKLNSFGGSCGIRRNAIRETT
jgi:hypothetical protein